MTLAELSKLKPGTPITLYCRTSDANIYVKSPTDDGRPRVVPTPLQIRATYYLISGHVSHIQQGEYTYLVLESVGERAQLAFPTAKMIGTKHGKKVQHVPIGAIQRYRTGLTA